VTIDPVVLALTQNRLDDISRRMGQVMLRTAHSPIFSQYHDFSNFITDAEGTLVSQADGVPIQSGNGGFTVWALVEAFGDDIHDGDVFLSNDPYVADGNHLPDWVVSQPAFAEGQLVGFACNRGHQSDIGGGAPGTVNPEATEIFHEGIRLPPLRIIERGKICEDIWQLLLINSRTPRLQDGDLRAMVGSTRIGADSVAALLPGRKAGHAIGLRYAGRWRRRQGRDDDVSRRQRGFRAPAVRQHGDRFVPHHRFFARGWRLGRSSRSGPRPRTA